MKLIKKILLDTLTSPAGKYSRKSLTTFASFQIMVIMSFIDMLTGFKINDLVFLTFTGMAGYQSTMSLYDKKKVPKNEV